MRAALSFLILFCSSLTAFAARQDALTEDQALIMAFEFYDGAIISEGISIYHVGPRWYLPLGELADGMDVAIRLSTTHQRAEGFVVDERRTVLVDPPNCKLVKVGVEEPFDCGMARIMNDELYVESGLFSRIMDVGLQFDLHKSLVIVQTSFPFPVQMKAERERKLVAPKGSTSNQPPADFPLVDNPSQWLAGPAIDQRIGLFMDGGNQTTNEDLVVNLQHDTFLAGELAGLSARMFLGGRDAHVKEQSFNLSDKSREGELLGSLRAREVQLVDYSFPPVPLLSAGGRVKGALVSSFPLDMTSNFDTQEFRGPLPSGWEVELYQNDTLIGRFAATEAAEYEFKDVILFYGINRFTLVFYGPQGQKNEEVRVINVDPNSIQKQKSYYRFATGQRHNSDRSVGLLQYAFGLTSWISMNTTLLRSAPKDGQEEINYGLIGLTGGLGRSILGLKLAANDDEEKGQATELSVQLPFDHVRIGASHTLLENFRSEQFNLEPTTDPVVSATQLRFHLGLPKLSGLQFSVDGTQKLREQGGQELSGVQRTTMAFGKSYWFNTLNYERSAEPTTSGELATIYAFKDVDLRAAVQYKTEVEGVGLSLQYYLNRTDSTDFDVQQSWVQDKLEFRFGLLRQLEKQSVSASLSADTLGQWQALLAFSYGAIFNPARRSFFVSPRSLSTEGTIDALVYLDLNHNKQMDPEEPPLPGIALQVNNQVVAGVTDENGRLLIAHQPTYQLLGLTISYKSLTDPMYRPLDRGQRIELRPGGILRVNVPIGIFSEVTGIVNFIKGQETRPAKSIEVQLHRLDQILSKTSTLFATTKTEGDGFYAIEGVPPGTYMLKVSPADLADRKRVAEPSSVMVMVPDRGLEGGSFDFVLK